MYEVCRIVLEGRDHPSRCAKHRALVPQRCAANASPDIGEKRGQRNLVPTGLARFEAGALPPQPDVERVSDRVLCILGGNPSTFTLNGTNIYLVGTGARRILIDAGEAGQRAANLAATLRKVFASEGVTGLDAIIVSHLHHDHVGGVSTMIKEFGATPVYKLPSPQWEIERRMEVVREAREFEGLAAHEVPKTAELTWQGLDFELNSGYSKLKEGQCIRTQGATLTIYVTPGHAPDHCVIRLEEEAALFSGDHVLGWGTSWVDDLFQYTQSLHKIKALACKRVFPGHGPMITNGPAHVERYIEHRRLREIQVYDALLALAPLSRGAPTTSRVVTLAIYRDTKDIDRAEGNVLKILAKLRADGKAMSLDPPGNVSSLDDVAQDEERKETGSDGRSEPGVASKEYTRKWLALESKGRL